MQSCHSNIYFNHNLYQQKFLCNFYPYPCVMCFCLNFYFPHRAKDKTDTDVLRENHRFLWRDEDEEDMTWWSSIVNYSYIVLLSTEIDFHICLCCLLLYFWAFSVPGKKNLPRRIMTSCLKSTA